MEASNEGVAQGGAGGAGAPAAASTGMSNLFGSLGRAAAAAFALPNAITSNALGSVGAALAAAPALPSLPTLPRSELSQRELGAWHGDRGWFASVVIVLWRACACALYPGLQPASAWVTSSCAPHPLTSPPPHLTPHPPHPTLVFRTRDLRASATAASQGFLAREVEYSRTSTAVYGRVLKEAQGVQADMGTLHESLEALGGQIGGARFIAARLAGLEVGGAAVAAAAPVEGAA